jgi:hypothetical protein
VREKQGGENEEKKTGWCFHDLWPAQFAGDDVLEGFNQFTGVLSAQFFNGIGMIVFSEKIGEVPFVPTEVLDQMPDIELLAEGHAVRVDPVMFAPGKVAHQTTETGLVQFPAAAHTGHLFKGIPVFLVAELQFFFGDVDDGDFLRIEHSVDNSDFECRL